MKTWLIYQLHSCNYLTYNFSCPISIEEARNLWTIYSILKAKIKKPKKVKSEIIDDKRRSSKAVANLDESSRSKNIDASDKNKQTEKTKERRKKKKEKWAIVKEGNHVHEGKGHGKAIRYINYNFKPIDWFNWIPSESRNC